MILIDVCSIYEWLDPGGPVRGGPVRLLNQTTPLRTLAHGRAYALFDRVFYPPPTTTTATTTSIARFSQMILIDVRSIFEWLDPGGPVRGGPVRLLNQARPLRTLAHGRAQALFDQFFYPPPTTITTTTTNQG